MNTFEQKRMTATNCTSMSYYVGTDELNPANTPLQNLGLSRQLSKYEPTMQLKSKARILTAPVCNETEAGVPRA